MKKKIAILGSTGSIGKTTLEILKKNEKDFEIFLLSANNNYKKLKEQALKYKAKNVIIKNYKYYLKLKKELKKKKIKVYNNFDILKKIPKNKIYYTMCAISGLEGLEPTLDTIKFSKIVGIANKESIICGWNLLRRNLIKYNTKFIPVDSEHYSIWNLTKNYQNQQIEQIIITASGGPFLNLPLKKINNATPKKAVKHPNWKMGKKISIDSATLMNKVFEIIEAYKIFEFDLNKYKILIHPQSYVHAIVKFNSGLIKIILHDTNMKIPIFNSIYGDSKKKLETQKINQNLLNNLTFLKIDKKRYPSIEIIKMLPKRRNSLFETVITSANDELVNLFIKNKIKFNDIVYYLKKILLDKQLIKYKGISPKSLNDIIRLSRLVRLKTQSISVEST